MSVGAPAVLLGLVAVPLLALWYRRLLAARAGRRAELAALGLPPSPSVARRGRHAPPALLLAALALLLVAVARPEVGVPLPRREGTVVLAVDVSSSMTAADTGPAAPTRLDAAKAAARTVVDRLPDGVRVGVVAFSSSGLVTQQPTGDRAGVKAAIDRLRPGGGSALGDGLRTALATATGRPVPADPAGPPGIDAPGPDLGYHGSAAVVLLSDGENTDAPDPLAVAELASGAGVRVHPVGLGRPEGTVVAVDGFRLATALDEPLLRTIAERTDGAYVAAADAGALPAVADALERRWTVETRRVEVTAPLAAAAGLLLLGGVALSLARTGRVL